MPLGIRKGRPPGRPEFWLKPEYSPLMSRRGMTADEVAAKSLQCALEYLPEFGMKSIFTNGLDNPYMSSDARAVIANDMRRERDTKRT